MDFRTLDQARKRRGVAAAALCRKAGVSYSTWWRLAAGEHKAQWRTLRRLSKALGEIERGVRERPHLIEIAYRLYVRELARHFEIDPHLVLSSDPHRRAAGDREWLLAAKVRACAVYGLVAELDIKAARVAQALGMSKQAIWLMLRRVEGWRAERTLIEELFMDTPTRVSAAA